MAIPMVALITEQNAAFSLQYLTQRCEFVPCSASLHVSFEDLLKLIVPSRPSSFSSSLRIAEGLAMLVKQTTLF